MGPVEVDTEWTVSEMSTARGCHQLGRRWQLSSSLLTVGMISMEQILGRRVEPTSREKESRELPEQLQNVVALLPLHHSLPSPRSRPISASQPLSHLPFPRRAHSVLPSHPPQLNWSTFHSTSHGLTSHLAHEPHKVPLAHLGTHVTRSYRVSLPYASFELQFYDGSVQSE